VVILLLPKERPFRELVEAGYQNGVYGVHAMNIQQYGKLSPVESHALQLRMLELLDLRAQIATLEKARSKETRERAKKADLRAVERRVRRSSAYGTPYRTG
jgi:hypothetical protein